MNYNDDDNRIRRRKVSSNDYNYKSKQHQRYYEEKVRLENASYERKIDNNRIKKYNTTKNTRTNKRKKANKKIRLKLAKVFLIIALVISVGVAAVGSVFAISSLKDTKVINKEILKESYISSEVVPDNEIPKYLKDALVSIEDERFYEHKGIDIISLTRSLLHNIFSDTTQGGSTIEMQISKNLLTSDDRNMKRKIKDKFMTKDEILCTYLNNVYFGKSAYGVGKASKVYFGKNVQDLTLAQSAMLVGITNSPAKYKEHREAKKRQEVILYKMKELGYIDEEEYSQAISENVPFKSEIE